MKKLIVCFMASIALTGVSHAQLTGIQTLEPVQRAPATARGSVMGAQFDDSVGTQGAFMAPDACPNLDGYQPSIPGGYVVINGSCEAPCVVPMTTTSTTSSNCPVGQTGVVYTTTEKSYSCPSAYGAPLMTSSVLNTSNTCIVNVSNINDLTGNYINVAMHEWSSKYNMTIRFMAPGEIYIDYVYGRRFANDPTLYSYFINNWGAYRSLGASYRFSCFDGPVVLTCYAGYQIKNLMDFGTPTLPAATLIITKSTGVVQFSHKSIESQAHPEVPLHTVRTQNICAGDVYASPGTYGKLPLAKRQCASSLYGDTYYNCPCN